jgi:serine protease AprX
VVRTDRTMQRDVAGRRRPGVRWSVGPRNAMRWLCAATAAVSVGASLLAAPGTAAAAGVNPADVPLGDTGALSTVTRIVGAQVQWDKGFTGRGVGVAVIDTGVSRVPGLDGAGKVIDGPDLSFERFGPQAHQDGFGHGTHMASIIAGSDLPIGTPRRRCTTCTALSPYSDSTKFEGVAPEARIVNVKVGAADGASDVSQIVAALDWVVQHRNDNGANIRVVNLSYGTRALQPADVDPLSFAAENAWRHGILVVVAAGNDGELDTTDLADPAYNPRVLAVGAAETHATLNPLDDYVPAFSEHGSHERPVDVIAPGTHILGLGVPGSYVDRTVTTGKEGRFQRGSGTSQAAAVVSGLAAIAFQRYPTATPDQVKTLLKANALAIEPVVKVKKKGSTDPRFVGAGLANVTRLEALPRVPAAPAYANGLGSIDRSRGEDRLVDDTGYVLAGEIDVYGRPWNAVERTTASRRATAWAGGSWNGWAWTGTGWSATGWGDTGIDWSADRWAGNRWTGKRWTGNRWTGNRWTNGQWSSGTWA